MQYLSAYLNFVLSPIYEHNDKVFRAMPFRYRSLLE